MKKRSGFILVMAIAVVGILSIMVIRSAIRLTVFTRLAHLLADREQARLLALSGVSYAIAQLSVDESAFKKGTSPDGKPAPIPPDKQFEIRVLRPLRVFNRWQKKQLTLEHDGVQGAMLWHITGDNGKLNLNSIGSATWKDKENETLRNATKYLCSKVFSNFNENRLSAENFIEKIGEIRTQRKRIFGDITDLYLEPALRVFPQQITPNPETPDASSLFDLFSTDRESVLISAWQFSPTIERALGLRRTQNISEEAWKQILEILKGTSKEEPLSVIMKTLYAYDATKLPKELLPLLTIKFEANLFSVVSYGAYNGVLVKVAAVLQRRPVHTGDQEMYRFFVKKVTWIT